MTLKDSIKSDMTSIFLVVSEFAESIVYYPYGGGSRSIKAIVDRDPPAFYNAAGEVVMAKYTIIIHNNCSTGVLAKEVNTGGDEVSILADHGDAVPERMTVSHKIAQDEGSVTLAVI